MKRIAAIGALLVLALWPAPADAAMTLERLSEEDIGTVKTLLEKWTPMIEAKKKDGTLAILAEEELFDGLTEKEKALLFGILKFGPEDLQVKTPYLGIETDFSGLVALKDQPVRRKGESAPLDTQYLPPQVYARYSEMMEAMKKDLGRRLYVESAYRSPAYQLYLFVYYLPTHDYSVFETAKWNALPGYSEHGCFKQQALDLINEEGENGDDSPEAFEALPEYAWLLRHAGEYGFVLSYPRGNPWGMNFEPWHWHFDEQQGE